MHTEGQDKSQSMSHTHHGRYVSVLKDVEVPAATTRTVCVDAPSQGSRSVPDRAPKPSHSKIRTERKED